MKDNLRQLIRIRFLKLNRTIATSQGIGAGIVRGKVALRGYPGSSDPSAILK